jgi:hypothetical protein
MEKIPELYPIIWQYGKRDIIKKFSVGRTTLNNVLRGICQNERALAGLVWFLNDKRKAFADDDNQCAQIDTYLVELNGRLKQARSNAKMKLVLMERRRKKAMKKKK